MMKLKTFFEKNIWPTVIFLGASAGLLILALAQQKQENNLGEEYMPEDFWIFLAASGFFASIWLGLLLGRLLEK